MQIRPKPVDVAKFSSTGLVKGDLLGRKINDQKMGKALAGKANFGLAKNTWATYQTTINHIKTCQLETGKDMSLPFDEVKTLIFVGWMEARGLKSSTMSTYLSGVRNYHINQLLDAPSLRIPLVKLVLKGQKNYDQLQDRMKLGRLPVTISMLKLLKKNLGKVDWPLSEKRLFWSVATLAFAGSFRIHELCSRDESEFCEQSTLLWGDVMEGNLKLDGKEIQSLTVHVKSPKIDRVGAGDNIQVFQLGNFMCPTAAFMRYRECSNVKEDTRQPVFRLDSGACFTGKEMNRRLAILTSCLKEILPGGEVKSHSFRMGVISEMARAGHCLEDMKQVGRWSSDSWKNYCKLPLTKRAKFARNISLGAK